MTAEMNRWYTGRKPGELSDFRLLLDGADSEPTSFGCRVGCFSSSPCSTTSKRNQFQGILLTAEPNEANLGTGWWGWGGQGEEVSV